MEGRQFSFNSLTPSVSHLSSLAFSLLSSMEGRTCDIAMFSSHDVYDLSLSSQHVVGPLGFIG